MKTKTKKKDELKFFSYEPILGYNCKYNVIFGERSNGKTFGALEIALVDYWKHKKQSAYIRRFFEDMRGKRGESLCQGLEAEGKIKEITDGKWDGKKELD